MILRIKHPFQIGLRQARPVAVVLFFISFIILYPQSIALVENLVISAGLAVLVFGLTYFSSWFYLRAGLEKLTSIIAQTPHTTDQFSKGTSETNRSELDQAIGIAEKNRRAIEKEFMRMDKTENYRKEFIGDISHELKTPLFSVQGYLETLESGAMEDPKVNRLFLGKAMKNVHRLILLTNDLMEISRLETGEMKPSLQIIPINSIIHDVIETLQFKAKKAMVTLAFKEKETNAFALGDRNQIRQVLVNLVENAIKYNNPGGYVHVHTRIESGKPDLIQISIKDSGLGIEEQDIKRITERFFRVDKSRSREQGGTGLGLAIVKHILESHGQQLEVSSISGKGSTFLFSLKNADFHSEPVSA